MVDHINKYFKKDAHRGKILFLASSKINDQSINDESKSIFFLIHEIANLNLSEANNRTIYINDYRPGTATLEYIESVVENTENIVLQSYFYDVLQVNKRNKFNTAKKAIELYREISQSEDTISKKREYYIRISHILQGLGKGNKTLIPETVPKIFEDIVTANIETESYSITKIAEELIPLNADCIDWRLYISKIQFGLQLFEHSGRFEQYRQCNHILAILIKEKQLDYGQNVARSYFWEADEYDKTPNISQHLILSLYKRGLKLFESLQIVSPEIIEKKRKLIEIQKKAAKQIIEFGIKRKLPI